MNGRALASLGILATLALAPRDAGAQARCDARPNVLVADLGLHVINAGYQRTVDCRVALQASAGLYSPWTVNRNVLGLAGADHTPEGDTLGGVLRARAFVYPLGRAPSGLWLSPYVQGGYVRGTRDGVSLGGFALALGASAGWALFLAQRVLLSLGVGAQFHAASFAGSATFPGFARAAPTVDINAGFAF